MQIDFILSIVILILSVVIHEVSHGYMAYAFGDPTAKLSGRLTLNPLKHIDLQGSIIVPLIAYALTGLIFGWAKPVPYNPYNLRNAKVGEPLVALAGPLSNIVIAVFFGLVIRFASASLPFVTLQAMSVIVIINIVLAVFNLMPIPPLDGSKVLFGILPMRFYYIRDFFEKNWIWIFLIFIFFIWKYMVPVIYFIFNLLTGNGGI